MSFGFLSQ